MLVVGFLITLLLLSFLSSMIYRKLLSQEVIDTFTQTYMLSIIANGMGFPMMYVMLYKLDDFQFLLSFVFSLVYSTIFLKLYSFVDIFG